jgi:hypothetical protein
MASSLCCFPRNRGIRNLREYSNARAALRDREAGSTFDQTIEDSDGSEQNFRGAVYFISFSCLLPAALLALQSRTEPIE